MKRNPQGCLRVGFSRVAALVLPAIVRSGLVGLANRSPRIISWVGALTMRIVAAYHALYVKFSSHCVAINRARKNENVGMGAPKSKIQNYVLAFHFAR